MKTILSICLMSLPMAAMAQQGYSNYQAQRVAYSNTGQHYHYQAQRVAPAYPQRQMGVTPVRQMPQPRAMAPVATAAPVAVPAPVAQAPSAYMMQGASIHPGPASHRAHKQLKPWYAGLKGELRMLEDWDATSTTTVEFDPGFAVSALGGYRFTESFRTELEVAFFSSDTDNITGEFEGYSTIVNGYLDYPVPDMPGLTPYVGAGVGGLFQTNGAEESGFVYQLMAGVAYEFDSGFAVAGGYKFQQAPGIFDSTAFTDDFDATSHNIELTLKQHF